MLILVGCQDSPESPRGEQGNRIERRGGRGLPNGSSEERQKQLETRLREMGELPDSWEIFSQEEKYSFMKEMRGEWGDQRGGRSEGREGGRFQTEEMPFPSSVQEAQIESESENIDPHLSQAS